MKYTDIYDLTMNKIRIFLCAAESSSFNTAAQKLHYSQSMVSKNIAELEHSLGLMLFIRENSRAILTPAGHSFYADCQGILSQLEDSILKAHNIQAGQMSSLSLGSCDTGTPFQVWERNVIAFSKQNPSISVQYDEYSMSHLIELAKKHAIEVIHTALHDAPSLEKEGYAWKLITPGSLAIFIPRSNPLFQAEKVGFQDLRAEKFIVLSPEANPNYIRLLTDLCRQFGFTPNIDSYITNASAFKINLLKTSCIALADTMTNIQHEDIKMFPLEDYPSGGILAWDQTSRNPNIEKFISLFQDPAGRPDLNPNLYLESHKDSGA